MGVPKEVGFEEPKSEGVVVAVVAPNIEGVVVVVEPNIPVVAGAVAPNGDEPVPNREVVAVGAPNIDGLVVAGVVEPNRDEVVEAPGANKDPPDIDE